MIYELLETKMEIHDARNKVKIDRSHRIGRKRERKQKPRPIVVKSIIKTESTEYVRLNTKKLKGTKIGVSEQFPEEIESIRKTLYPELKKARAECKMVRIVRDKLIIEGQVFHNNRSILTICNLSPLYISLTKHNSYFIVNFLIQILHYKPFQ